MTDPLATAPFAPKGARWFLGVGATIYHQRGWRTKAEAAAWIASLRLAWQVGFTFGIHGSSAVWAVMDRRGHVARFT